MLAIIFILSFLVSAVILVYILYKLKYLGLLDDHNVGVLLDLDRHLMDEIRECQEIKSKLKKDSAGWHFYSGMLSSANELREKLNEYINGV